MKNIAEITAILERISELLRIGGKNEWAERIDQYRSELPGDTAHAISKIITLYGGLGSINDIVLYSNGQPMIQENNELDQLLSKLHDRCVGS
ncbi:DUF6966 domain-containing protein [Pseudomonas sp. GM74]|uniref:DUF6966 domain-containing protein n=1 Tax=Pseudomonas sp. GM74 TaxID=1144336 RepID=UPI0012F9B9E5|nr:hypothetical protein [Pseudomonas sp. GM74]